MAAAVIFDMDGVLVDSGAHHRAAWRDLLAELGVTPARPDFWRLTIGRPGHEAVPLLLGRALAGAEARRLAARKHELYLARARAGPGPGCPPSAARPASWPTSWPGGFPWPSPRRPPATTPSCCWAGWASGRTSRWWWRPTT